MSEPSIADLELLAASLAEEPDELAPFADEPNGSDEPSDDAFDGRGR